MSAPNKPLVRDQNQVPAPQYYDSVGDIFDYLQGANGAQFANEHPDATSIFAYSTVYSSSGLETEGVIKASAGTLYKMFVTTNVGSGTYYIQLFNSASAPAEGTAPLVTRVITSTATDKELDFGKFGLYFSTGIFYCISSTIATKTNTGVTSNFFVTAFGA